ncbi:hypothetical protein WMF45_44990 [Sorangium sp. So ce448]|uniref:hypothetical protein n=1 Tax=Sorangium sp. So ce448 TaxID=3133314 RepID=UPI003F60825C
MADVPLGAPSRIDSVALSGRSSPASNARSIATFSARCSAYALQRPQKPVSPPAWPT